MRAPTIDPVLLLHTPGKRPDFRIVWIVHGQMAHRLSRLNLAIKTTIANRFFLTRKLVLRIESQYGVKLLQRKIVMPKLEQCVPCRAFCLDAQRHCRRFFG
ncbi:hypothetical protein D3C86_1603230 [compost metagenome]